ncbi:hypothetical protein [Pseudodesulfovibrio sp.]|uniref:hypothetical protein n=1 Tax=unclassified Pseudodesulfovibrio TaxID=2661612 RepID=UPI003B007CDC
MSRKMLMSLIGGLLLLVALYAFAPAITGEDNRFAFIGRILNDQQEMTQEQRIAQELHKILTQVHDNI